MNLVIFPRSLIVLLLCLAAPSALAFQENTGGARGDGIADDTAALQSVLNSGQTVFLGFSKTYRITRRLDIVRDNSGIVGDGTASLLMGVGPGEFDNASKAKYAANAVGVFASGVSGARVEGLRIRAERLTENRVVKAIALRKCASFRISGNDMANFSEANGIVYIGESQHGVISGNDIHDGFINPRSRAQLSGIVLDDDDQGSSDIAITGNHIHDLTVGAEFFARFGYQTDGINITVRNDHIDVSGNRIENVGEAIDSFATNTTITGNRIAAAHAYGIKFVHGASFSVVSGNVVSDSGIGGIVLASSPTAARDTASNVITGNRVSGVNGDGVYDNHTTFGIGIVLNGSHTHVTGNRIENNIVDTGGTAMFGILAEKGTGTDNVISGNTVKGWRREAYRLDPVSVPGGAQ